MCLQFSPRRTRLPMSVRLKPFTSLVLVAGLILPLTGAVKTREQGAETGRAVFWRDPGNIAERDLFWGPGGSRHQPRGPFTFVKEDLDGSNPKFVVRAS